MEGGYFMLNHLMLFFNLSFFAWVAMPEEFPQYLGPLLEDIFDRMLRCRTVPSVWN
jgi:hypothetical protein